MEEIIGQREKSLESDNILCVLERLQIVIGL